MIIRWEESAHAAAIKGLLVAGGTLSQLPPAVLLRGGGSQADVASSSSTSVCILNTGCGHSWKCHCEDLAAHASVGCALASQALRSTGQLASRLSIWHASLSAGCASGQGLLGAGRECAW